ncbi:MAG: hypothetical protein NXH90_12865 [Flavobacteriaceae bacterium]|nr:hypothetical protein [Flavobacteriaceae bacterium]
MTRLLNHDLKTHFSIRYIFVITLICLLSCKAQKQGNSPVGEHIDGLSLIEQQNFTDIDSFETRVIRDTKSLNKFYSQINKTRKPGLPVPMVDFSKDMLVLVGLGEQQGEKTAVLSKIKETDQEMLIAIEVRNVSEEEMSIQPVYFPIYLYKMPLVDKTLIFQRVNN